MKEHDKIRVLYVQPGKYPEERWVRDELTDLQKLVDGLIECVYPWWDDMACLVCNDEGLIRSMPLNRRVPDYGIIAGPFFVCGLQENNFGSLTDEQMKRYEKLFHDPQLFLNTPAGIMVMHCSPEQYDRIMSERSARKPREENVR